MDRRIPRCDTPSNSSASGLRRRERPPTPATQRHCLRICPPLPPLPCVCLYSGATNSHRTAVGLVCGLGRPYRQSAKRLGVRPASRALDKLNDRRDVFPQHVVAVRNEKAVCHRVSPFLVSSRAARRLADDRTKRTGVVQETSVRSRSECRLSPNQISAAARRRLRLYFIPRPGGGGRRDRSALCRGEHHHDRHRSHP
jgi:hypothetical protein